MRSNRPDAVVNLSPQPFQHVMTVVRAKRRVAERVLEITLADPDDWELPPFAPGAHIDVHLPGGIVRQYSLCGDPREGSRYRLGILLQAAGRGGSRALHDAVAVGDVLPVSLPRNHFPLAADAQRHMFIAGGIGITPFLSMAHALGAAGSDFHLYACARNRETAPFIDDLRPLLASGQASTYYGGGDPRGGLDLRALLAVSQPGTHVYCCGPIGMMEAVAAAAAGWPAETVHFERFQPPGEVLPAQEAPFSVRLSRSDRMIPVAPGQSIARALLQHGVALDVSCEAGTCGACRTRYLEGEPEHRDLVLRPHERARYIMPCVSGCLSSHLVLDL